MWAIPAQQAFMPWAKPLIIESDAGIVAMAVEEIWDGMKVATPLECGWGLAAPFAGPDPDRLISTLATAWKRLFPAIDAVLLSGLPAQGPWRDAVIGRFLRSHRVGAGETCIRRMSSLAQGYEGFLALRSSKFRSNLKRSIRQATQAGMAFDYRRTGQRKELFKRMMAIEERSWKGRAGEGINTGTPRSFYKMILKRLLEKNAVRILFAQIDGKDIGYVFGGVANGIYRGLQISFDDEFKSLSPGNLLQIELIKLLCEEGVSTYDLGTDIEYKTRWAEASFETVTWAIFQN